MRAEVKDGIISLIFGVLIFAALILFGYFGASSQNSLLKAAYILLSILAWPLAVFYHDREAPIIVIAAVAIFDVIIISGFVFILRTWLRSRRRMRLPHAKTDSER